MQNNEEKNKTDLIRLETQRLDALRAWDLLDTPPEEAFDRITKLATDALGIPVALISLVDKDRQFFKSQQGLPDPVATTRETPLSHSFCKHVAATREVLIVEDARVHEFLSENPAVRDLNVVGYAGVPLVDQSGYCLGALCAIDTKPRAWTARDVDLLKSLAAQVMTEMELKKRNRDIAVMKREDADRKTRARLTVHDLRTPLNSLILSLELLNGLGELNSDQTEWINLAKRSGITLKELVDDLVDNEAITEKGFHALSLTECDPKQLVQAALDQITGSAHAKNISLRTQLAVELPRVTVDEQKMTRVLVNLLGNAIKFTPEQGSIVVSGTQRDGNRIALSVVDTGIGFAPDQIPTIFEKGMVLEKNSSTQFSTGWGLEFCKLMVDAHAGTIEVSSAPGQGSTFTVVIPVFSSHRDGQK